MLMPVERKATTKKVEVRLWRYVSVSHDLVFFVSGHFVLDFVQSPQQQGQ